MTVLDIITKNGRAGVAGRVILLLSDGLVGENPPQMSEIDLIVTSLL